VIAIIFSLALLFISPVIFDMTMETFEEFYMVLPVVYTIVLPGTYLTNFINISIVGIYFVFHGNEEIVDLIEDAVEILLIGFGAILISKQYLKLRKKIDELEYESNYDQICLVENRNALRKKLNALSQTTQMNCDLLIIEMENYRMTRDVFGIEHYNLFLKGMTEELRKHLTEKDKIYALGINEFVIVHFRFDSEENDKLVKDILNTNKASISINGYNHNIGLNIGISSYPEDTVDYEQLYVLASFALRESIKKGENTYERFKPEFSLEAEKIVDMVTELRLALEERQFRAFYQLKNQVSNRDIVGAEALVRWQHPEKGLISPFYFIDICEDYGFIVELGYQMLEMACIDIKRFAPLVDDFVVSVNVSAIQLKEKDFVENVEKIIIEHGVAFSSIELEITESTIIENIDTVIMQIEKLRNLGVSISMDDFGVDYSSFSTLKDLPIDVLKLDRLFVKDIEFRKKDLVILKAMIKTGHELGFTVLAEGVETLEQLESLNKLGCDQFQGYLVGKPVPIDLLLEKIKMLNDDRK